MFITDRFYDSACYSSKQHPTLNPVGQRQRWYNTNITQQSYRSFLVHPPPPKHPHNLIRFSLPEDEKDVVLLSKGAQLGGIAAPADSRDLLHFHRTAERADCCRCCCYRTSQHRELRCDPVIASTPTATAGGVPEIYSPFYRTVVSYSV